MIKHLHDETTIQRWILYLGNHHKSRLETISTTYPKQTRSISIDYDDLDQAQPELAELLLSQPCITLESAEEAVKQIDTANGYLELHVRIVNPPDIIKRPIRKLRSSDMGRFISVEGLVKRDTRVRATLLVSAFQCQKCGAVVRIEQDEDLLKEPSECFEDQGGCGRVSSFKLLATSSEFIDHQKLEIQENPEGLRGAEKPSTITVILRDDIVGVVSPGDRVRVTGVLKGVQVQRGGLKFNQFDFRLEANSVEINESLYTDVSITDEDVAEIKAASKRPYLLDDFKQSLIPAIHGRDVEKEALTLQLFGGVKKTLVDNTTIRGDIHVLFVGDPGTAKSQMLKAMVRNTPRGLLASGSSATKAGLTATAVKDDFSEGQWVLDAGALVLADGGLACIDEFEKMSHEDRGSIHQAMEQQEISVNKAGINATLMSRCSVLAAANPKLGRFDECVSLYEQIDLPPALLSRFDLVFPIIDRPDKIADGEMADFILRSHQDPRNILLKPAFTPEFIRKYVAYAKQNITPCLSDAALKILREYYVQCRANSGDSVPFTPRQLEGFVRLAEASARLRLSSTVTMEDAERATELVGAYLAKVGVDRETGNLDIDVLESGMSRSIQKKAHIIEGIIRRLMTDGGADRNEVITEAEIQGVNASSVETILQRLKRDGRVIEAGGGRVRLNED